MAVIQAPNFTMNPYERFQVLNRQNQWYDENRWQTAAKEGSLAREADIISRAEKELGDYDAYVQKYHLDRAPDNQMLYLALTKDLYADDTELKDYTFEEWNENRVKYVHNDSSNPNQVMAVKDPGYETVTKQMTEKQYLEKLLNDWVEYDNALLQQAQIEQARKNVPWYKKLGALVGDTFINAAQGIDNTLQGIGDVFSGTGAGFEEGFKALFRGDNPFTAFLEGYRNDPKNQTGSNSNLQALADALNIDYNNVWLQDANGNYNQAGQIISNVATTLGEMAPSILANMVLPGIASINLGGAPLTAGATKAIGRGTMAAYYSSMWNRRNVERFNDPDFASVPTWSILLESTVQTATDIVIEQTLGKLIGASGIDKLMYGAAAAGGSGITKLTKANIIKKLIANGLHEGLEEISQDVVANITTQLLGLKWEAFGKDDITWDDIINTFVVSFTIGILGAGAEMLGTERRVVGENTRLSKGKSWLANMNEQALWQQYQKLASNKNMTAEQRMKLMSSMRISMETVASMYTAFGEDTMARINGRLNQIQQRLENMPQFVYEQSVNPDYRQERMVELSREYVGAVQDSLHQLEMDSLGIDSYAEIDVATLEGGEKAQAEQYNKYRQLERELAERRKNIDGSEKNQTTGDKLRDANIYQVHDFISAQDTNVQPNEKKGRTQKRTNLAKKIAKATGKNTAYSNGTNVVETDSTYIVPGNMADNCSDMEVLRAAAENELVDTLVTKLDRKILDQFRDAYRATQSDKRKASYEDTVRALLFNEDFARVMFANANEEMYGFISNLQQVLKIAAGNKLTDKMMSKVIDSVITAYKPIIAEYVTNQQNVDINQLYKRGIFEDQELNDIRRNRWGIDLTNKIQDQKTYNKLTENEQRVIDNRVNYLTIDKALKDQIKSDLKSSSVAARMRAMRQLDAEYSNKFFSKYNNRIYFERTTPANNWFNDFMQKTGINLINIKTGKYSKAFLDVVANAVDDQNNHYKSPNDYIVDQFEEYTQGAYSVTIDGARVIPVQNNVDTSIYTEGAMDYYNDLYGITQSAMQEQAGTWVIPSHDIELMNKVMKNIVDGAKVDDINLAYTNINDVVQNPFNYLTSEVLNDIMEDYKEVNNYTTFQYLRDLILDKYETISLSRKQNGDIVFVDLTSAYDSLVPNIANMSKSTNSIFNKYVGKGPIDITTFIQKKYLSPELEGYKVVFINDPNATAGDHNYLTKTITINGAKTNAFTKFVLLHEMQHAIQSANKLAGGMSPYFVVSDQLLADFEKNMPQLFGKSTNTETKKDIVRWFLYRTASGEVDANLYGDSIAFVQTLVKNSVGDTAEMVTPWGTEHKIRFETKAQAKQRSKAPKTQIKAPKTQQIQQDERVDESLKERQQNVTSELERRLTETDAEITRIKNDSRKDARKFLEYAVQEYGDIDFRIKGTKIPNSSITWQEVMDLAGYTEEDITRIYNEAVDKEYNRMAAEHDRSQYSTMSDDYYEEMLRTSAKNYVRDHVKFGDKVSNEYVDLGNKTKNTIYLLQKLEKTRSDLMNQIGRSNESFEVITDTKNDLDFLLNNEAFEGPENDAQPKQTNKFVQRRVRKGKPGAKKRYNSERDYISRDFAKGTNLEPFVGRYIARDMQEFIMEASPTRLPYELWSKIENGTLNYYDVHNYFRTNPDIDDYTFNLIRNSFWPNSWFKTNAELNQFLELDLRYFYALSNVLYEAGFEVDVTKPMSREAVMTLYNQILQSPEFKEKLERKSANAFDTARLNKQTRKIEYIPLDIDFAHLRVSAMELMDGSIDGAAHVIATARAIATSHKYGQIWNTADIDKTAKHLEEGTRGHKADDGESGTFGDIVADVKTSRDMLDQALEDKIASSTKLQKSMLLYEYYGNIIRKKHPDYASWSDGQQRKAMKLIQKKVNSLTEEEFEAMYRKALSKQLGVNYSERAISNKKIDTQKHSAQVRRNNIVRSIKSFGSQVTNYIKTSQWKNIPDTYKQYFDEDGKLKSSIYEETDLSPNEQGEYPQLRDIQSKLASLASALRRGDFTTKSGSNVFLRNQRLKDELQSEKGKNKKLKAQLALVSKKGTFIIQSQSQEFKMQSDIDIPEKLRTLLNTQFDKTAQSFVQYIKNPDSEHTVYNAKQFFEKNAELFDKITVDEIEQIIRFFDSALLLEADEATLDKFKILQIYTLAHFIEGAREGRWNISSHYLEVAESILHRVSDAGRQLAAWRAVMYKVNPNKVLTQKLAESLGVEVDEEDVNALADAVKTGDVRKIHRAQQNLLRNTLMKYKSVDVAKVKNTVLNNMVDEKGTDLSIILATPNIALNEQTKQTITKKYGAINKENVIKYIQEQTKNVDKNVSFEETSEGYNFISRTDKRATTKVLKKLTDKANATINDVITKPNEFLTEKAKAEIKETYGAINEKAILLYAQDVAIDTTKSVMPIKTAEGYQFVDFSNNKSTIMNKLLTFQKAMMLSGPNTVLRNQVSNITLYYGNELADVLGHFVTKIATKIKRKIKPNQKVALTKVDQYDLTGVKVTDEVYNFVQKQIIDNHLLELIEDGASKYDTRKSKANTGVDVLTDMVVNTIIGDIARNNTYNNDVMNSIVQTIFKWQSDAHFINKAAKRYIGKLLTVTQVDITKGLSEDVMKVIAEAYRFAAFEYMHKTNVMNELENKLRERAPKVYAGYKMIFPFMPSAWNWFVESMNWSPIGIVRGITQLCRLENTVNKVLNDRQKGKLTLDPRLTKFMAQRTLGKGILGSFLLGLGILLGSIGVMQVDDDDDRLKLKIGDIYFDISSVFGTTSLLVGAQLAQPSEGNFLNVLEPAFNLVAEESFFGDLSDMFSYNKTAWDILLEKPADILGTFVPNFLKSINKLFYTHEVKYSSSFMGSLQYLAASSIPFLAYAFPKKIDPFTGETQSRYSLPFALDFLTDLVNVASPIRIKPKNVSWMEEQAIMLGLNKSELSGKYDDIGQVNYQILNTKYGQLNAKDLARLMNNQQRYTVEDKRTGKEKDLFWSQMTDEQKKTVIERIMSYNSRYAKIYAWTQSGHKYYASNSEWQALRKLGIAQNVFKGDKGFVA